MPQLSPRQVSLDQVLASLEHHQQDWNMRPSETTLKLEFLDRIPNYDNKNMDYYHTYHPGDPLRDIYTVNEHLAVLLSVVLNTLVLLVFIRVLGLARLPSRLIVSLAAVNLVSSLSLALHTTAVTTKYFSSSENMCRFVTGLLYECDILFYYAHCGAIVERMVACNMPGFYSRALHIVGPAVIVSPWAVWILNIILMNAGVYDFDLGYECGSHTNRLLPHHSMASGKRFALRISLVVLFGLFLSIIFNNQSSGDVWEINRTQFELRTTRVILKLAAIVTAFILPETLTPIYMFNGLTYKETRIMHITMQLSAHKGLCLILVLLSRKEFRRHLVLVFESRESIRRTRTTNLLISHAPARGFSSSRQLRFSDARSSREMMGSADSQNGMEQPAIVVPAAMPSLASQSVEKSGLVSRDKITGVQTPDWLRKKETPAAWSLSRFFKKHQSPTISTCGSDV